jgi:flagellar hook assembly protein FlgD
MDISALNNNSSAGAPAGTSDGIQSAFRTADFLKVMLSELSHQDPMSPQDTSKIVENMQKLQELANTQYTKFRNDVGWAQNLMGQQVEVQQQGGLDEKTITAYMNRGLNPDVGFANKSGVIKSFRVLGESVYVQVGDYDYPIDNVKQVIPNAKDPATLSRVADQLMGREVGYKDRAGASKQGTVTAVGWGTDGQVQLEIGGSLTIPYSSITAITIPPGANTK